ncbi:MAG: hypothetical protein KA257_05950 [Opitutaceae bacterium]|nr:hypothetical protein [Opitutaceae bacterium]
MRSISAAISATLFIAIKMCAAELVVNGSFEQIVHDFPAGWVRANNTGISAYGLDAGIDGEHALRMECPMPGSTVEVFQPDLAMLAGEKYVLSFQARGDQTPVGKLQVQIKGESAQSTPILEASVEILKEWHSFHLEFSPKDPLPTNTCLVFSFSPSGRLWLDQVSLQGKVASTDRKDVPQWQPRLTSAGGKNLVPNSSFECGNDGWLSLGKKLSFGGNVAGLYGEVIEDGGCDGNRAFQLRLGPGRTPESFYDCWPPEHIVHHRLLAVNQGWIEVDRGRTYTLSGYMRSDRPGTKGVLFLKFSGDASNPGSTFMREFQLTSGWERYSYTVVAPETGVFVGIGPDTSAIPNEIVTFWADAIQLEAGEAATSVSTREAIELGFNTDRYGNIYSAGEPITFDLVAHNSSSAMKAVTVRLMLTDYWDQPLPESTIALCIPGGATSQKRVSVDLPAGWYRAHFSWTVSGLENSRILRLAVIEPFAYRDSPFGLNHGPTTADAIRQIMKAGVTWVRDWSVNWEWAEPQPGRRSFADIDPQIQRLRDQDMNVLSLLPSNPSTNWASSAPTSVPPTLWYRLAYAPKDPELLFDFVADAATRFRTTVDHWEFLNEPLWVPDFCLPKKGGYKVADYIALLKGASAAIRRANPKAKVIGGLSIQSEMIFGDEFIKGGGLDYVDILNLHPYADRRTPESFIADLLRIRAALDQHATRKQIWATETAYYGLDQFPLLPWHPPANHFAANRLLASERQAADYLVRFSTIMLAHGVAKIFWHQPLTGDANQGLNDVENVFIAPSGVPRKTYAALSGLANVLGSAPIFSGQWELPVSENGTVTPEVLGYSFAANGHVAMVIWSTNDKTTAERWVLKMPVGCTGRNVVGAALEGDRIPLSESPVYVVSTTLTPEELSRQCLLEKAP